MYTYESFVSHGTFTLLRPVSFTLLLVSLVVFLSILIPQTRRKFINGFSVIIMAALTSVMTLQLIFYNGILADELNLSGDGVSLTIGILILALNGLNLVTYYSRRYTKKH